MRDATNVMSIQVNSKLVLMVINEFNSEQLIFVTIDNEYTPIDYASYGYKDGAKCTDGTHGSLWDVLDIAKERE